MDQPPELRRTPKPQRQYRSKRRATPIAGLPMEETKTTSRIYRSRQRPWLQKTKYALLAVLVVALAFGGWRLVSWYAANEAERRAQEAEAAERARHPLYYRDIIERTADRFSIEPSLIAAVILAESSFDATAESRVDARGLMQLMPDTAEWIAGKVDEPDYSFDKLYTPDTNILFGGWYLGYLCNRFDGDTMLAICAYHAGQGNVDAWLKNPKYSADGVTLLKIPTEDTQRYYSRVSSAQAVYNKYYFSPPTDPIPS